MHKQRRPEELSLMVWSEIPVYRTSDRREKRTEVFQADLYDRTLRMYDCQDVWAGIKNGGIR